MTTSTGLVLWFLLPCSEDSFVQNKHVWCWRYHFSLWPLFDCEAVVSCFPEVKVVHSSLNAYISLSTFFFFCIGKF